ncbi:MAG TPA: hypothetical protein VFB27_02790 [Opitutaceae bacterium]|nr:hypothetical protein [Opitutaceae bacterium]
MHNVPEPIVTEARAKLVWGEPPAKVLAYLREKNLGDKDAMEALRELLAENAQDRRRDGFKKILGGAFLILLPIGYYLLARTVGFIQLKLFSILILLGIIGIWRCLDGIFMILRPNTGAKAGL